MSINDSCPPSEHDKLIVSLSTMPDEDTLHHRMQHSPGRSLRISREPRNTFTRKADHIHEKFQYTGTDIPNDADHNDVGQWVSVANQVPDSLDYEFAENELLREERLRRGGGVHPPKWKAWIVLILIGAMTAVVAFGIDKGIKGLQTLKFTAMNHYLATPGSNFNASIDNNATAPGDHNLEIQFFVPLVIYVVINWMYVLVAAVLVIWVAPMAKGSGIAEIKCYLNGIRLFRVVRVKTFFCKAIGILFSVAAGLPCGKEGPMIHCGAALGAGISTGKSSKLHLDTGLLQEFRHDRTKRAFVTAGAAAGVGAAFGAPVGGLLFAVEEAGSFWNVELTVSVFVCASVTTFVLQCLMDPSQYAGNARGLIDFGEVVGEYRFYDIPFLALLGLCGALLGALFNHLNLKLAHYRRRHINTKFRQLTEVFAVSFLVSMAMIVLVLRGYSCVDFPPDADPELLQERLSYGCPKGQLNDMATYFFRSMEESIALLIHAPDGKKNISYQQLLLQFVIYYFLTIINFGINVPSGLFLPTLALGANFGQFYAQVWNIVLPGEHYLNPASYALFGGTAVLGGVTRMTISIVVIVMEATANVSFFFPLVIITVITKFVGDYFNKGIYDMYIEFNRIPLLEVDMEHPEMHLLEASDVVNPKVVTLPPVVKVKDLLRTLKHNPNVNGLLIVDPESRKFKGILLRRAAILLIVKRAWERDLGMADFVKSAKERELLKLKKYHTLDVSKEARNQTINLMRYCDRWPYTFQATTPLPRIHRTVRELGLRHVIILDENREPVGIIGRKQLCFLEFADPQAIPRKPPTPLHSPPRSPAGSFRGESSTSPSGFGINNNSDSDLDWDDAYKKNVN
jgi:chloride channel 7